jgi:hypothetical protein
MDKGTMTADGFDAALAGTCYRNGQQLAVYNVHKVIKILMDRDLMTAGEAQEFFEFNIEGAWMGDGTPIWWYPKED